MCCSWAVFSSGPVCGREQRHGKVVFQQSCMKFNLLSQKAFNPFYTVILLNLVPKWGHLEEKPALSSTKTIKTSIHGCFSAKQAPKNANLYPWPCHSEKHDHCFWTHNPASPTCLRHCWVVDGWTAVDISGWICQTDSDKLRRTAAAHFYIHSLVICPSIEFAEFPIIRPPINMRIVLHEYHHPACSNGYFIRTHQDCHRHIIHFFMNLFQTWVKGR